MRVFRYFASESGLLSLTNKTLLWKDARSFNDPFELRPQVPNSLAGVLKYAESPSTTLTDGDRAELKKALPTDSGGVESRMRSSS